MVSLPHSPPTTTSRLQETRRYIPYSFDPPPLINLDAADLKLSVDQFQESELIKSKMATTSNADSVLLLAALETLGDSDQGGSDQGGSSRGGQGDMSLSPRSSNSRTTPPSAATDSSSGQSYTGEVDKPGSSSSYGYNQSSAYSHPTYNNSLQHPLYSRPIAPSPAYPPPPPSNYSLPPINRSTYTPYNYQSSYSRPLSSSGPGQGQIGSVSGSTANGGGSTTLPPLNIASLSNPDSSFRPFQTSSSSGGATNPASYAQSTSQNPYNQPGYGSASSHTYQHPAYARATLSSSTGSSAYPAPFPASTNPYSHPALPGSTSSSSFSAPNSPWSGPPPPPLSLSASTGSLLAKRRRSETAGLGIISSGNASSAANGLVRSASDQLEEKDELEEEEETKGSEEREESASVTGTASQKGSNAGEDGEEEREERGGDEGNEEAEDETEDLAPQVKASRPAKRARLSSAKSDDGTIKPPTKIRPKASISKTPAIKAKATTKKTPEKQKEPPEKKFVCPHPSCGRAFARHFNLNSHIKSHQGIREFKCPECNKLFSRKHDCTRHCIAIHHYDKDSGKAPIHEPSTSRRPTTTTSQAPGQPLPPATSLLHASSEASTGNAQPALQSLARLLQTPVASIAPSEQAVASVSAIDAEATST